MAGGPRADQSPLAEASVAAAAVSAAAEEPGPPARVRARSIGHRIRGRLPGVAGGVLVAFVMVVLFGPVLMLGRLSPSTDSSIISAALGGAATAKWYEEAWSNGQARDAVVTR